MGGRASERPRLPDGFWARQDVRQALIDRDFGALFRLVAKYAGASQTQIAIAVGMTQGQISTIVAGDRRVTAIDVAERALDGFDAPDMARVAFGLAPRGVPTRLDVAQIGLPLQDADTGVSAPDELAIEDVQRRDVLRGGAAALGAVAASEIRAQRLAQVSRALTSHPLWAPIPPNGRPAPTVKELAVKVAYAKRSYQACRYADVIDALPRLLESAQLVCDAATGDEALQAHALAADAYQVTGSVMLKLGDLGLAAFAADRSIEAASRSHDPVAVAASARIVTHSLMSGGHAQRAKEVASQAARRLAGEVRNPDSDALSVYGALVLRGAIAAAICEDRDDASEMLTEAGESALRLSNDDNAHWTAFGPTNVAVHRVHVAMTLGDAGTAVHLARQINVAQLPIAERKAALFIDTASALVQWGKHEQAYYALRMADKVAPEEVRTQETVRRLLGDLAGRASTGVRSRVREFAEQIGAQL
jgi:tetratricopeptide (TPR) repeat protein